MKTDSQLQKDVIDELEWEPAVHADEIDVQVKNGIVTLSGEVCSFAEKWNAERAAQRVNGVKGLNEELEVNLLDTGRRTDAQITESAKNILSWTSSLPANAIQVEVEDGWLTLSGDVEWQFQRQDAADSLRYLTGVTGVSNDIAIKPSRVPSPAASAVKSDIQAALNRRAVADARAIEVQVKGSEVTLSGTVDSWAERDLVTRTAWGSAGVLNVVDKINLIY